LLPIVQAHPPAVQAARMKTLRAFQNQGIHEEAALRAASFCFPEGISAFKCVPDLQATGALEHFNFEKV